MFVRIFTSVGETVSTDETAEALEKLLCTAVFTTVL